MKRFAGLYMNEDPSAPNYDPKHKIIRSIWNGSKGPMMRKATTYDWVGDPVPGMFHILHGPHGRNKLVDLMSVYDKMLSHCAEYLDSVGDHPLNLGATNLALRAYMLTHEDKYRDWALEYVNAWKGWVAEAGGMIPTNIGLDGKIGGEYDGQWWKGTYGWNFTIYDGEIDQIANRNTVTSGSWPGFGNAFLLTGDQAYVDVLRKQLDLIYAQKKIVDGKEVYPSMYGDPRHHTKNGPPEWYRFGSKPHLGRATEVYLWSMNRDDLEHVPMDGWVGFLEGNNPDYPEQALQRDFETIRRQIRRVDEDDTTPDTRLPDYLLGFSPAQTDTLTNLMLGGYFAGKLWTLHSRVRYFDPTKRRAGPSRGCGVAGREADRRLAHAHPGQCESDRSPACHRTGRRLWRAPVSFCDDQRPNDGNRFADLECPLGAWLRSADCVQDETLCQSADPRTPLGSRLDGQTVDGVRPPHAQERSQALLDFRA